jgi:RNA-directed DNA polymerase
MRDREAEAYASKASAEGDGRNLSRAANGAETRTATGGETKPEAGQGLLEAALERSNMMRAYQRVVENKGAPGVDGLTVLELKPWLQAHWAKIKQALLAGEYMPRAVRKVEIPKPQGGVRILGIPCVLDRFCPAGGVAGSAEALGPDVLRTQPRISTGAKREASGARGAAVYR